MKKILLLAISVVLALSGYAQSSFNLIEGEPAMIYSLPKTAFSIEIETEKITQQPGIFYRYSERYLATSSVITEEKTSYKIKNISIKTVAIPDSTRTFSFFPSKSSQASHISVNAKGLLCGINNPVESKLGDVQKVDFTSATNQTLPELLPLGEEYMMAGSEAKLAEGAAKQIYHIRDSRLSLLTADVDHMPADGTSLNAMLDGLNKQEKKLTELFIGRTTTETQTQIIHFLPIKAVSNQVLFRFSTLRGVVAANDLSGTPYFYSINPEKLTITPADPKAKKENTTLFYVLPASTAFAINDGLKTVFSGQYFIPQFGVLIPFSEELLKQSKLKVSIDAETGRLLSIE
jgi:hypothetical protein